VALAGHRPIQLDERMIEDSTIGGAFVAARGNRSTAIKIRSAERGRSLGGGQGEAKSPRLSVTLPLLVDAMRSGEHQVRRNEHPGTFGKGGLSAKRLRGAEIEDLGGWPGREFHATVSVDLQQRFWHQSHGTLCRQIPEYGRCGKGLHAIVRAVDHGLIERAYGIHTPARATHHRD